MTIDIPIIAAIIAFIAGATAQWLSHRFTESRELQKHHIEAYQKFYAPIMPDVLNFIEMRTHARRGHDVNEEEEREIHNKIIKHIDDNLIYASPAIILAHHQMNTSSLSDQTGFYPSYGFIDLMMSFMNELEYSMRNSKAFSRYTNTKNDIVIKYKILYLLWDILAYKNDIGFEGAIYIMSLKYFFDDKRMTQRNYNRLKKFYNQRYTTKHIIDFCKNSLISDQKDRNTFTEITESDKERIKQVYPPYEENWTDNQDSLNNKDEDMIGFKKLFMSYEKEGSNFIVSKTVKIEISKSGQYYANDSQVLEFNSKNSFVELVCADRNKYYISQNTFHSFFMG